MKLLAGNQALRAECQLEDDGFEIVNDVLSPDECEALSGEIAILISRQITTTRSKIGGLRNLLRSVPRVAELASSNLIKRILKDRVQTDVFPVRALFFDKTPETNWSVGWHQDLSIAVAEKIETEMYEGWSVKEGVVHVQPPREVLEGMVTLRLHLDDCTADNGALRVVPRSHLRGKIKPVDPAIEKNDENAFVCEVMKGGALLMRPLLLHSSLSAKKPSHRRVLHIEYASDSLPNGLKWFAW